jgi:hypothetical protein
MTDIVDARVAHGSLIPLTFMSYQKVHLKDKGTGEFFITADSDFTDSSLLSMWIISAK